MVCVSAHLKRTVHRCQFGRDGMQSLFKVVGEIGKLLPKCLLDSESIIHENPRTSRTKDALPDLGVDCPGPLCFGVEEFFPCIIEILMTTKSDSKQTETNPNHLYIPTVRDQGVEDTLSDHRFVISSVHFQRE
jgi:hypothetical protein